MLKILLPLLVMFAVLLPIQGDAACAWVLWSRTNFSSTVKASWESVDILAAFESLEDCRFELNARVKKLHEQRRKKPHEKGVSKIEYMDRGVMTFYNGEKNFKATTLICLPDTIDLWQRR